MSGLTDESHADSARISSSPSFSPGTIRVVTSTWQRGAARAMDRLTVSRSPPRCRYQLWVKPFRSIFTASSSGRQFQPGSFFDGAVGYQYNIESGLMNQFGTIAYILVPYKGFVIRISTGRCCLFLAAPAPFAPIVRGYSPGCTFLPPAAAIDAFWQKGQCRLQPKLPTDSTPAAGVKVPQRLFFDGIKGQGREFAIVERDQCSHSGFPGPGRRRSGPPIGYSGENIGGMLPS